MTMWFLVLPFGLLHRICPRGVVLSMFYVCAVGTEHTYVNMQTCTHRKTIGFSSSPTADCMVSKISDYSTLQTLFTKPEVHKDWTVSPTCIATVPFSLESSMAIQPEVPCMWNGLPPSPLVSSFLEWWSLFGCFLGTLETRVNVLSCHKANRRLGYRNVPCLSGLNEPKDWGMNSEEARGKGQCSAPEKKKVLTMIFILYQTPLQCLFLFT